MRSHKQGIPMHGSSTWPRVAIALANLALALATTGVHAHGSRGTEVDDTCTALNGTKPYTASGSSPERCGLCHGENRAIRHDPEWGWVQAGAEGQKNFCVVRGIIEKPESDITVSQGATVTYTARGFSPTKGVGQVNFVWGFSDRPDFHPEGASVAVPMPNAPSPDGKVTVSVSMADADGGTDPGYTAAEARWNERTITVSTAPTAANGDRYTVTAGNTLTVAAPGVLGNDTGTGTLTAALLALPTHGALTLNPNGGFSYTPAAAYAGRDTFTYQASNGVFASDPVTVNISVAAAVPVANADRYALRPGQVLKVAVPGVLSNDAGSGKLTALLVTNASKGMVVLNPNGSFIYTPTARGSGLDSFVYMVRNATGTSAPATVTLSAGACTDLDKDGYSVEGGDCGPLDCNDNNPAVNPAAKEICNNQIDDDCNRLVDTRDPSCTGKDCIGRLLEQAQYAAEQVRIDQAGWVGDVLTVAGRSNAPGAAVTLTDPDAAKPIGATTVDGTGAWRFTKTLAAAPCHVTAEVLGRRIQRPVSGAPVECQASSSCK